MNEERTAERIRELENAISLYQNIKAETAEILGWVSMLTSPAYDREWRTGVARRDFSERRETVERLLSYTQEEYSDIALLSFEATRLRESLDRFDEAIKPYLPNQQSL